MIYVFLMSVTSETTEVVSDVAYIGNKAVSDVTIVGNKAVSEISTIAYKDDIGNKLVLQISPSVLNRF